MKMKYIMVRDGYKTFSLQVVLYSGSNIRSILIIMYIFHLPTFRLSCGHKLYLVQLDNRYWIAKRGRGILKYCIKQIERYSYRRLNLLNLIILFQMSRKGKQMMDFSMYQPYLDCFISSPLLHLSLKNPKKGIFCKESKDGDLL